MTVSQNRKNLDEVSFIRPILIVLLVLYHAFAPWTDAWAPFDGLTSNEAYMWIADISYSFMLPMFVFLSGYVWSFQREVLGRIVPLGKLANKKFRRLIVPSIIFSLAYLLLIENSCDSIVAVLISIISGVAHMWFLPMLFWCFFFGWLILQIPNKYVQLFLIGFLLFFSVVDLPFQINVSFYYLFFFLLGYTIQKFAEIIKSKVSKNHVVLSWFVFIVSFIFSHNILYYISEIRGTYPFAINTMLYESGICLKVIYSTFGTVALYTTALVFISSHKLSVLYMRIGQYCFGVYLFQQFILKALYYNSPLTSFLSSNIVPWCGFIIALLGSLVLSYLLRKTKFGKALI